MSLVAPRFLTCPTCGEKRDTSGNYTSPANRERDRVWWREVHESGKCAELAPEDR